MFAPGRRYAAYAYGQPMPARSLKVIACVICCFALDFVLDRSFLPSGWQSSTSFTGNAVLC